MPQKHTSYQKEDILNATTRGRDIILRLCPDAYKGQNLKPNHFKLHEGDENTASCIPFFTGGVDGVWIVKSFGASDTVDVFSLIQEKVAGVSNFIEALQWAGKEFGLAGGSTKFDSAKIEFKAATKKQKDGEYFYNYRKKLTPLELETLGPIVTQEVCDLYNVKSVVSFTQIKQYEKGSKGYQKYGDTPQQIITKASDTYPIYVIDAGDWQKIYQPLNKDKGFRFRYAPKGNKSSEHIFGLEQLETQLQDYKDNYDWDDDEERDYEKLRLPYVIIGGGDRDSLNVAAMDYPVVWFNSETATLDYATFAELKKYAHKVCYLGDIDATGIKEMYSKALQLVDLYIIELPKWITKTTYRSKPRKDLTDWVNLVHDKKKPGKVLAAFDKLVKTALPARFWDEKYKGKKFNGYDFNNEAAFQFLKFQGFYRLEEKNAKDSFSFVRVVDNIVSRQEPHHISDFPYQWLKEKNYPIALRNSIIRSAQLAEKKMSKLEAYQPDFKDSSANHQLLFFNNNVWNVTAEEIKVLRYDSNNLTTQVWEDKIIPQSPNYSSSPFFKTEWQNGKWDIEILNTENHFFNFLINSSRVNWRELGNDPFLKRRDEINTIDPEKYLAQLTEIEKDYQEYHEKTRFNIAEPGLDPELIQEQKEHLLSKIYIIGYLLHTHKMPSRAWQVHAMDHRISANGRSNGGSGKTVAFNTCLRSLRPATKFVDGKDMDPQKDSFIYDGVTEDTDLVLIDDLNPKYPLTKFFAKVTSDFVVNPKGQTAYTLEYNESPKIITTSNYGIPQVDGSTKRRLLYWVASDYYHAEDDTCFKLEHQPKEDIKLDLITDFTPEQYSSFINFMAQCLQFYLAQEIKLKAPEGNIVKRNALESMGGAFFSWAESYFSDENGNPSEKLNMYIPAKELRLLCKNDCEFSRFSPQAFKSKLDHWAKYRGYNINPRRICNKQGYNKHNYNGKTIEFVYVQSPGHLPKEWDTSHVQEVHEEADPVVTTTQYPKGDNPFTENDDIN